MVVVTRSMVLGGRTEAGPGLPRTTPGSGPTKTGDVARSRGHKPLLLLCMEEDRYRLGILPPLGPSGAEAPSQQMPWRQQDDGLQASAGCWGHGGWDFGSAAVSGLNVQAGRGWGSWGPPERRCVAAFADFPIVLRYWAVLVMLLCSCI